jgi:hypothetical protein
MYIQFHVLTLLTLEKGGTCCSEKSAEMRVATRKVVEQWMA